MILTGLQNATSLATEQGSEGNHQWRAKNLDGAVSCRRYYYARLGSGTVPAPGATLVTLLLVLDRRQIKIRHSDLTAQCADQTTGNAHADEAAAQARVAGSGFDAGG